MPGFTTHYIFGMKSYNDLPNIEPDPQPDTIPAHMTAAIVTANVFTNDFLITFDLLSPNGSLIFATCFCVINSRLYPL